MHMNRWALAAILLAGALPVAAQTFGEITGAVVDASGAVVSGATVKVMNAATSLLRQVETNDTGNYTVPFLPPGTYQIRVEKSGFKSATRSDILLQVADSVRVNFNL